MIEEATKKAREAAEKFADDSGSRLGNIQKVRDGEPLGGRTNASSEFETLDDDDFLS